MKRITLLLVRPRYAENVGSAARVALNMGMTSLALVGARELDGETMLKTATHNAASLVKSLVHYETFGQAAAHYSLLVATTARQGRQRYSTTLPKDLAKQVLPKIQTGRVALVFGPENTGLSNEELKHCGIITTIPTAAFSSMNLAQAIAIICYELYQGAQLYRNSEDGVVLRPRSAKPAEIAAMVDAAGQVVGRLDTLGKPPLAGTRMRHLHQLLARLQLSAKEAKLIKDVCLQVSDLVTKHHAK